MVGRLRAGARTGRARAIAALLVAALGASLAAPADAAEQSQRAPGNRSLSTGAPIVPRAIRRAAARPKAQPSTEDAERAARQAEARRKFFEKKPDDDRGEAIPDFGGYDASKAGDGSFRPGATFRF